MIKKLEYKKLERIIKGIANHRRLQILNLLKCEPDLSVQEIAGKVKSDIKNISAHVSKMAIAGLVTKRYEGSLVRHKLTNRGKSILQFIRILE